MGMNTWRILLFQLALIYGLATSTRNKLFDWGILKSHQISIPSIGVGNLSVGGTGKSVVIDYLISNYHRNFKIGVLSRGFGRITRGVVVADQTSSASTIGDEPFQFYSKYSDISLVVAEKRIQGMNRLNQMNRQLDLILLDDVLQHRYITPSLIILTTTFDKPYFSDSILPVGNLRELKSGAQRAKMIFVTKCPMNLTQVQMDLFTRKLNLNPDQKLFFTRIKYSRLIKNTITELPLKELKNNFVLVTGIANPSPLVKYLKELNLKFHHLEFSDHHIFTPNDLSRINMLNKHGTILTTEKDFTRLNPLIENNSLFYLPITMEFINPIMETQFKEYLNRSL